MNINLLFKKQSLVVCTALLLFFSVTQSFGQGIKWSNDGVSYYQIDKGELVQYTLPQNTPKVVISKQQLTPEGANQPLKLNFYSFSTDQQKALIFTNTQKVWRLNSKGDYWVLDMKTGALNQLGKSLPASSLMFAKFSPDGQSVAYVSGNNI